MLRYESEAQRTRREKAATEAMLKKAANNADAIDASNRLAYDQRAMQTKRDIEHFREMKEAEEGFRKREAQREEARQAELQRQLKIADESENESVINFV